VALALEALEGLELDLPKGVTCHHRRWANKVGHALGAARRELERARALAEGRPPNGALRDLRRPWWRYG
jgi:hypothetical protein